MRRYLIASCLVLAVFALFSATQAQADTIDNFTYQAGANTFQWQLPASPTVLASNIIPGFSFTIPNVAFSENGIVQNPADVEFFSVLNLGGGFDFKVLVFDPVTQSFFPLISAVGPSIYAGPESTPTFLTGTFSMTDFGNANAVGIASTLAITSTSVPEPSSLMLLGTGMLVLLGFARKKAIVYRHNASDMVVA
jgi:hypothetical protein